jgi:hypothetical protein
MGTGEFVPGVRLRRSASTAERCFALAREALPPIEEGLTGTLMECALAAAAVVIAGAGEGAEGPT